RRWLCDLSGRERCGQPGCDRHWRQRRTSAPAATGPGRAALRLVDDFCPRCRRAESVYNECKLGCPMKFSRIMVALVSVAALVTASSAGDKDPAPDLSQAPKISKQTRVQLVQLLTAELVY